VRVLLDENLPHKLRLHLPEHEVVMVAFPGFDGLKNGKLMKSAEDAGFDVFVTDDRALPYQQSMARFGLSSRLMSNGSPSPFQPLSPARLPVWIVASFRGDGSPMRSD
jgi:hypothetical protein